MAFTFSDPKIQPYGLPVASLPAAGELGGAAFEMADAQGNITRAGTMVQNPQTGELEANYPDELLGRTQDQPGASALSPTDLGIDAPTSDPVKIIEWQGQQKLSQLSAFDKQIADIKVPIQHKLDTSYKQLMVDVNAVRNSGMDQQQQNQRINQLSANYQKKWISIKSEIEPQTQALQQQKAAVRQEIILNQALQLKEIQTYAQMEEDGLIDAATSMSRQIMVAGYDVPVSEFRPPKVQTPHETVQTMRSTLKTLKERLDSFKTDMYNPKGWGKSQRKRPALYVKSPGSTGSLDTDWELADPHQQSVYENLLTQYIGAQEILDAA
ncbi:MAG: hypothetical protein JRE28_10440, partial [Deltaproteobacteria bacterium]|nr:hypothetical protein [Deltaproteobacteria bacterium]